ncbi:hypothetical protein ABKV19_023399, partial [Rosa sericea]
IHTLLKFGGYALLRNSSSLFQSFGFDTQSVIIGLIIFQHTITVITPIQHLVRFASNLVSRAFEFQTDDFAKKLGYASSLRASLVRLQEEFFVSYEHRSMVLGISRSIPRLFKGWLQLVMWTRKQTDRKSAYMLYES